MVKRLVKAGTARSLQTMFLGGAVGLLLATLGWTSAGVRAQPGSGTITLRADVQEANAVTGVITARGNVQIDYPERDIYATSAQAQYFSNERRMILSGNVVVLQEGNRLEAETVTYLVDEGRFVALPQPNRQVRSTYILPAEDPATPAEETPAAGDDDGSDAFAPLLPDTELNISPAGPGGLGSPETQTEPLPE